MIYKDLEYFHPVFLSARKSSEQGFTYTMPYFLKKDVYRDYKEIYFALDMYQVRII